MKDVMTVLVLVLFSSIATAGQLEIDECGFPRLGDNISAEFEYFKNADDQTAQKLLVDYKERIQDSIQAIDSSIKAIRSTMDKNFICYQAAEIASSAKEIGRNLGLIFLLNRPGKSCFTYSKFEFGMSLRTTPAGSGFNPITAMANVCGASGGDFTSYDGMKGNFKALPEFLDQLNERMQRIKGALSVYRVREK